MGLLDGLEKKLGLPSLQEVTNLLEGDTGKRLNLLLNRLERISKDGTNIKDAVSLLTLVKELDEKGTIQRLLDLLRELSPLLKGKQTEALLEKLGHLEGLVGNLLKE